MNRCVQVDRETAYLLPPSVDEWLPINHLARFVVDVMDQLDLSRLTGAYTGRGSAAHHPWVLLGLLVYGYATGVFSSRKIERATHDSVAFRYMAANTHPDHDTLATFRTRFLLELEDLFVQVLVAGADDEPDPAGPDCAGRQQGSGERALMDNGYFSAANVSACAGQGIEPLIALGREGHHLSLDARFGPEPSTDDPVKNMAWRLRTRDGHARYAQRKSTVEPVFGIIQHVMGLRQCSLRGLAAVTGEWTLVTLAYNLKRMNVLRFA